MAVVDGVRWHWCKTMIGVVGCGDGVGGGIGVWVGLMLATMVGSDVALVVCGSVVAKMIDGGGSGSRLEM
ncbi:hypothetical protein Tco_0819461 [Tanacetum coccineum]|uniref:Transmembrane protein n=1 Tax=Tanacetum coccineum TaxID=301880 RepID=A0ABQ5A9A4_9ASTR